MHKFCGRTDIALKEFKAAPWFYIRFKEFFHSDIKDFVKLVYCFGTAFFKACPSPAYNHGRQCREYRLILIFYTEINVFLI